MFVYFIFFISLENYAPEYILKIKPSSKQVEGSFLFVVLF